MKYFAVVFGSRFGWGMHKQHSFKVVNLTVKEKLPLFMSPPRDPLIDRTPYWKDALYRVTGNIFGLPNAPYLWTEESEVVGRLTSLNYVRLDFDKMLFLKYDDNNEIMSLICYVDDFFSHSSAGLRHIRGAQEVHMGRVAVFRD